MEIRKYQREAFTTLPEHNSKKEAISEWLIGLAEEVGELASLVKHKYYKADATIKDEDIADEAGDVLWYLAALCSELELDLNVVANLNLAKIQHRFEESYDETKVYQRKKSDQTFKSTELYHLLIDKLKVREKR